MKICIVGATGRTGRHVSAVALARGHSVTAVARRPEALSDLDARVHVRHGDVLDAPTIQAALSGCDSVISTLGAGTTRAQTTLYSAGVGALLGAMHQQGIRRLAVISAIPAAPRADAPFVERTLLMPILDRFFGTTYDDMRRMERVLESESELDWTCLRPPRLLAKKATGAYRIDTARLARARSITFPDLAAALVDSLDRPDLYRRPAFVAN